MKKSNITVILLSFLYLLFFLVSNSWLATTTYHSYYILVVYLLIGIIFTIPFVFWFFSFTKLDLTYSNIILLSLFWAFIEWLRLFFLTGFPFSPLGYYFCSIPLFQRIVGVFGVYACSFVVVFAILLLIRAIKKRKLGSFIGFLWVVFLCLAFPERKLQKENVKTIKVFPVQPGGLVSEKTFSKEFISTFIPLDEQLTIILDKLEFIVGEKVEIILLPEGVLTGFIEQKNFSSFLMIDFFRRNHLTVPKIFLENSYLSQIEIFKELSTALDAAIVFGGNRYDQFYHAYNSLIVIEPCQSVQFYDKRILVPMGESIPFSWLTSLAQKYGITGVYHPGKANFIKIREFDVLPSICYEDCFPLFNWGQLKKKPDFMINITNDGWFFPSSLAKVHAGLSRLRVLEIGVPMIRVCEQAESGWIRADGTSFLFDEKNVLLPVLEVSLENEQKYYFLMKEKWLFFGIFLFLVFKVKGIFNRLRFKLAQKRKLV